MAGAREPLVIGPFAGGLNTYDDPTAVQDNEVVEALNFDPGLEGSLKSRPPFEDLGTSLALQATGDAHLLGFFYASDGQEYLIASDGLSKTYYYLNGAWTVLTAGFAATAMAQFDGKAWLVSPVTSLSPGGYWTPAGGFVADSNMPHGDSILAYKFRLFVAPGKNAPNGTRVYYSKVLGQANFWTAPGFVDIGAGDGQSIVHLMLYYNSLVIFRTGSIYTFEYISDPATGAVSVLVPGVGLTSKECVVAYENYLYFMYDEKGYEFISNRAHQINVKVPFTALSKANVASPFAVSLFNERIVFSYYDTMYVFSLKTRTWTRWRTPTYGAIGKIVSPQADDAVTTAYAIPSSVVPAGATRQCKLLRITDAVGNVGEPFTCELQTKNYNYKLASNNKRLFWWGVDALFRSKIKGQAFPVVYNNQVTWGQLIAGGVTWGQLLSGTWGSPFIGDTSEATEYDLNNLGSTRKFVKFRKSMRFRQIYFKIVFDTDGSVGTAPVQVFTLTADVATKERVSKAIS